MVKLTREITRREEELVWQAKIKLLRTYAFIRKVMNTKGAVLLFYLLSLHKEGCLNSVRIDRLFIRGWLASAKSTGGDAVKQHYYRLISNFLSSAVSNLKKEDFRRIVTEISSVKIQGTEHLNYAELFDKLLYGVLKGENNLANVHLLPSGVNKLIVGLSRSGRMEHVYNPFAGMASFYLNDVPSSQYVGQEKDFKAWSIGVLRAIANDRLNNFDFRNEDSLEKWPLQGDKFDLVVSAAPFGFIRDSEGKRARGYEWLLKDSRIVKLLKPHGRFILLCGEDVLYDQEKFRGQRKNFIDQDLLEYVISFPGGMLSHTSASIVILGGSLDKKVKEEVKFVDGGEYLKGTVSSDLKIDAQKLLADLLMGADWRTKTASITKATLAEIKENDYILLKNRYLERANNGRRLEEILTSVSKPIGRDVDFQGVVRVKDLNDGKSNDLYLTSYSLLGKAFEENEVGSCIDESCLLVAMQGEELKPTLFKSNGDTLFLGTSVHAFKINDTKEVLPEYLASELQRSDVQEWLNNFRQGSLLKRLNVEDFLDMDIFIPSLPEQQARLELFRLHQEKINEVSAGLEAVVEEKNRELFMDASSLRHTMGTPIFKIKSASKLLERFFREEEERNNLKINNSFKERLQRERDLYDVFEGLRKDAEYISNLMKFAGRSENFEKYSISLIPIRDIHHIVAQISDEDYNFTLKKKIPDTENAKHQGMAADATLLRMLIENILTNANKHGFPPLEEGVQGIRKKDKNGNEVVIELRPINDRLVLEIKNNGLPFSKQVPQKQFVKKFVTTDAGQGKGIGGYDIDQIAKYLGAPDWQLISDADVLYTVRFIFEFPLKQIS